MDKGFIKLPRSFFDNKIWQAARAFSECEAWIDLKEGNILHPIDFLLKNGEDLSNGLNLSSEN